MGPERALLAVYEAPDLVHDMINFMFSLQEQYVFPVVEALPPEIIAMWEDFCYNKGTLISPDIPQSGGASPGTNVAGK